MECRNSWEVLFDPVNSINGYYSQRTSLDNNPFRLSAEHEKAVTTFDFNYRMSNGSAKSASPSPQISQIYGFTRISQVLNPPSITPLKLSRSMGSSIEFSFRISDENTPIVNSNAVTEFPCYATPALEEKSCTTHFTPLSNRTEPPMVTPAVLVFASQPVDSTHARIAKRLEAMSYQDPEDENEENMALMEQQLQEI